MDILFFVHFILLHFIHWYRYDVYVRYLTRSQYTELLHTKQIQSNNTNEHLHYNWHWHSRLAHSTTGNGGVKLPPQHPVKLVVEDVMPLTGVEFAVNAFNSLGHSAVSKPSNIIIMIGDEASVDTSLSSQSRSVVYGIEYRRSEIGITRSTARKVDQLGTYQAMMALPSRSEVVNNWVGIDPVQQMLYVAHSSDGATHANPKAVSLDESKDASQLLTYEGWGFHYSPGLNYVAGKVVMPTLSTTASSPSIYDIGHLATFVEDYYGRIVLLVRGQIPLVFKILSAQVNGV